MEGAAAAGLADFTTDLGLVAMLTDFRTAHNPTIARLSYIFRKKAGVAGIPQSSEDFEFIVFGGGDEARSMPSKVRRRIAIDVLDALRDAEGLRQLLRPRVPADEGAATAQMADA